MNAWLWLLVSSVALWIALVNAFAAVMHAKAIVGRGERLHWSFKGPLLCAAAVGYIIDCAWNWTFGCAIFRERPRRMTFTARCAHHKRGSGWRRERALWWCRELSKFDPGHC